VARDLRIVERGRRVWPAGRLCSSGCLEAEEEEEEGRWRPGGKRRKALAARAKDEDGLVDAALASEESQRGGPRRGPAASVRFDWKQREGEGR